MTKSALIISSSIFVWFEKRVVMRLLYCASISARRWMSRSITVTSPPIPVATKIALLPTTPPPMTATFAGVTPGTPPSKTPRPWWAISKQVAPACTAMRPATWLMGASSGRPPLSSVTVSYAMHEEPLSISPLVCFGSGARWR